MKRLLLLRHAKAVPNGPADHARALAPRGLADAAAVGRAILARGWRPDLAIVSDALRTRQTFERLALGTQAPLRLDRRLYDATPAAILGSIAETAASVATLLVVGHNPGLAATAQALATTGAADDLARLAADFPTACLAVLTFEKDWADLAAAGGHLAALLWTNTDDPA